MYTKHTTYRFKPDGTMETIHSEAPSVICAGLPVRVTITADTCPTFTAGLLRQLADELAPVNQV